ncbi:GNAT family N-acetyltransferase [Tropicimonas isoalkanivorans]|uniref:Acetyltransferase (GNAT) family protein n=1 Tax=Tropicimonas isoalkanivorans TaxID=441112 RepID=A0A1I1P4Y0_9RHOB|nr:GNAT family N-acetyltransferase [Tropicimonas isoalkanivorans]SFD02043.1 Acetyltransferase (GNAT) family protein [Tropicimonas isoalkanivorans]
MTPPASSALFSALDATWPAASIAEVPGWCVREGKGGGSRVSAATAKVGSADIAEMERAHTAFGQRPLVMVRYGEDALDARLAAAGYRVKDPVIALACPVAVLAEAPPPVTAYHVAWPPVQIQVEIWEQGGIGPARLAVMDRVVGPRIALLGRSGDRPAGTAFAAIHGNIAMVHALEVRRDMRRKGAARHIMQAAALWAQTQGATWLAVLVTRENAPAKALYASLGLGAVEEYHYREL